MKGLHVKGLLFATVLCVVSLVVFAASGGKGKKKSVSTSTTSSKLSTLTKISTTKISLRSNYEFKGNKLFTVTSKKDVTSFNNYTSIKKGNKTVVVASKHTLAKPAISLNNNSTHVNVKIAKISLN